jgi:HAAS
MSLLDTYISEVGRHLPRKNRRDIEAEIRSTIEDILEERSQKSDKAIDEELTLAVLKEYGSPEHVAASYLPERYLVGPRLYPLFWLILRIVLAVIGVIALITLGIKLAQPGLVLGTAATLIFNSFLNFAASAMSVLGNLVLVFAILQYFLPEFKIDFKDEPDKWDPRTLKDITPTDRVKIGETVIEIIGACAAIVIFNFYPQLVSFTPSLNGLFDNGTVVTFPVLSEAFFRYVPFLTAIWGLTIVLDIVLLRQGSWKPATRWGLIALKAASVGMAVAMLIGPSLVAVTVASLTAGLGDAEAAGILFTLITQLVRVGLVLAIIFGGVDIIKSVIRLFRPASPQPIAS